MIISASVGIPQVWWRPADRPRGPRVGAQTLRRHLLSPGVRQEAAVRGASTTKLLNIFVWFIIFSEGAVTVPGVPGGGVRRGGDAAAGQGEDRLDVPPHGGRAGQVRLRG